MQAAVDAHTLTAPAFLCSATDDTDRQTDKCAVSASAETLAQWLQAPEFETIMSSFAQPLISPVSGPPIKCPVPTNICLLGPQLAFCRAQNHQIQHAPCTVMAAFVARLPTNTPSAFLAFSFLNPSFAQHTVCHSCLWHHRTENHLSILHSPYSHMPGSYACHASGTADSLHAGKPVTVLDVGRVSAAAPCLYL